MSSAFVPTHYAIDFGTTNSLLAAANRDEVTRPIPLDPTASDPTVLRSVLFFPNADRVFFGAEALAQYAASGMHGRLIRSIKKHLPSRLFVGTYIDERPMNLEHLIGAFLREMRVRADRHFGHEVRRVVLGRPARYAQDDDDDKHAENRMRLAAEYAGFEEVSFLPEPVAAARDFRRVAGAASRALIADLGGGTSDFTIIRLGQAAFRKEDVLGIGGVAQAGDAYDASLMRSHVARHFGSDVVYRVPMGSNEMRMPPALVEKLCSPADLSILRSQDVLAFLRNIQSWSVGKEDHEKIERLFTLIEDGLGFQIFESIERVKRALSQQERAEFRFSYPTIELRDEISRDAFERASERVTDAITRTLDATVAQSGLPAEAVDVVCATGGTARLPRIRAALRERYARARIEEFNTFHSVIEGLGEHARAVARDEAA